MRTSEVVTLAVGTLVLLGLTGCSSGTPAQGNGGNESGQTQEPEESKGAVYDFTQINGMEPASKITFTIPEEIVDLETDYSENRVLRSVTAESVDLGSAEYCGIELTYEYASDDIIDRIASKPLTTGGRGGVLVETPESKMTYALGLAGHGSITVGEPPAEPAVEGSFASEDFSSVINVRRCAESSFDDDSGVETAVGFRSLTDTTVGARDAGEGVFRTSETAASEDGYVLTDVIETDSVGSVTINVMRNGDLAVVSGELSDYRLDANGDWIAF